MWDVIVIGSGISGLTAAAALSRSGQKVLLLEQHWLAGGLTQSFKREQWHFATGVHYLTGLAEEDGAGGQFRRMLAWLSGDALRFAQLANPYDYVRVGDFSFGIAHPQARFKADLIERFPAERDAIERWFEEIDRAIASSHLLLAERGMPRWLAMAARFWKAAEVDHFARRTVAQALEGITDPYLRTVLGARGANYGAAAEDVPLLEHALICGAYNSGAFYPVGGPAVFAKALVPIIESSGGKVVLGADVTAIDLTSGHVSGVTYRRGNQDVTEQARHVISTMGIANTLARLPADTAPDWRGAAEKLSPGPGYVALYLGFSDDIAASGASSANNWHYETPQDIGRYWENPAEQDSPGLFVTFPSLKDPAHQGPPTSEVLALCDTAAFAQFMEADPTARDAAYAPFKAAIEARMVAQFRRLWPQLGDRIAFQELSTPLSQRRFVRTPMGAMYGLEMSGDRIRSHALSVRTPVPGLLLAGQDVTGAGVQPSAISGLLAAAAIRPELFRHLNG